MKQIHIRRFLSLLLAALTLWAAAVTAGSDSAAAALQQLRQGQPPAPAGAALGAGGLLRSGLSVRRHGDDAGPVPPCCWQAAALWQLCCPPV